MTNKFLAVSITSGLKKKKGDVECLGVSVERLTLDVSSGLDLKVVKSSSHIGLYPWHGAYFKKNVDVVGRHVAL